MIETDVQETETPYKVIGWRNFWIHPEKGTCVGEMLHATKEIAEKYAQLWKDKHQGTSWVYLGAFEVGE